ncbi:unnamed protein product [Ectocarpus sp. CCAP 1310/34]|nr:unnamed protein product [Ectocarpus sp. CCAP 1310/34]
MSDWISISKIRLQNIPVPVEGRPDFFRVVFFDGTMEVRTKSKRANLDGLVQWTERLEVLADDTAIKLVATVQQRSFLGDWVAGPDFHFSGSSLPSKWRHTSELPSAHKFYAELSVDCQEYLPPSTSSDKSEAHFRGPSKLPSPSAFSFSGLGSVRKGSDSSSPSSVAATSKTLLSSAVGGGFFGDGTRRGASLEGFSASSAVSASWPSRATHETRPRYSYPLRQEGGLWGVVGSTGMVLRSRPLLAMSQSFSWSPPASPIARPKDASAFQQRVGASEAAGESSPPSSSCFSWSPLVSPLALPDEAPERKWVTAGAAATGSGATLAPILPGPARSGSSSRRRVEPPVALADNLTAVQQFREADGISPGNKFATTLDIVDGQRKLAGLQSEMTMFPEPSIDAMQHHRKEEFLTQNLHDVVAELGADHVQAAVALDQLALCARGFGRLGEAESFFRQALRIKEQKLSHGDLEVVWTLEGLGRCLREQGRAREAELCLSRVVQVKQAKLGPHDKSVAVTLHELARCVRQTGRVEEAEGLLRQALSIKEALAPYDMSVAVTLHELGRCTRAAGRPEEARKLLERALQTKKANVGVHNLEVACTLHELGLCMLQTRQINDAAFLFEQALQIKEDKLGDCHPQVAVTLHELGRCWRVAGRLPEAQTLLERALQIKEARLPPHHLEISWTLIELGRFFREAGRSREAETLLRRALQIQETNLGHEHMSVNWTLHDLSLCAKNAGSSRNMARRLR